MLRVPAGLKTCALLVAGLCFAGKPVGVLAAGYSFEPRVSLNAEYRDSEVEDSGSSDLTEYNLYPSFDFRRSQDDSELNLGLDFHFRRFDNDNFDSDEYSVNTQYQKRFERFSYTLSGSARRQSTFIEAEEGETAGVDPSRTDDVDSQNLSAQLFYRFSLRQSLSFTAGASIREYEDTTRFDSDTYFMSARYQYLFAERLNWILTARATDFNSDDDTFDFNAGEYFIAIDNVVPLPDDIRFQLANAAARECSTLGFEGSTVDLNNIALQEIFFFGNDVPPVPCYSAVRNDNDSQVLAVETGINYLISENLTLEILAGVEEVSIDRTTDYEIAANPDIDIDTSNTNETYHVSLDYDQDRMHYRLNARKETIAQSSGAVESREDASFYISRNVTERNNLSLLLRWLKEETNEGLLSADDRERYQGEIKLTHQLAQHWSSSLRYRYFDEELGSSIETTQHSVLLTLGWSPTPKTWRR